MIFYDAFYKKWATAFIQLKEDLSEIKTYLGSNLIPKTLAIWQLTRALVKQPNLRKRGNMRGLVRQKQKVYWSRITEKTERLDRIKVYEKPVLYSFSVSSTAGTPEEIAAGIVPDYDRYITSFNRNFHPQEADIFWIDRIPQISEDGSLILNKDGEPTVLPDYTLKKILDTQKGNIARYGISKKGNEDG